MTWVMVKNTFWRILATFVVSGMGVIGAGTIAGVSVTTSVFMAGIGGVATVLEGLARAFLADGKLTQEELDGVFAQVENDYPDDK